MSIEQLFEEAAELERLFEEEPQVHDIDELIQAAVVTKRELSEGRIVKEAISPGRADMREGGAGSMKDESQPTPLSRPKAVVRRASAASVAWHAGVASIARLFGRKALAGRCR
ncbi:hypothetical protein [Rhizobium sp. BK379]|uniref:hypothetical protein n=1 Tax=Rhizobium sp. BK379 TaxID=2587059 RepID=UPI00160A344D|nr:hypothetical protein [Rhizobium sp. BK379]MBB3441249.1 hypothetical protein [Rhizobium sp. BK379]